MGSHSPTVREPLPDNACPRCGTLMAHSTEALPYPVRGRDFMFPGIPHLRCPACDEVLISVEQAKALREAAEQAGTGGEGCPLCYPGECRAVFHREEGDTL